MTVVGYAFLFALTAALSLSTAIFFWQRRSAPGAAAFSIATLLMVVWPLVQAIDVTTADLALKIFLMKLRFDPPVFAVIFVLWVIAELTNQTHLFSWKHIAALFVIPMIGMILNWSGPNPLFRYDFYVDTSGIVLTLHWANGPLFWVWFVYVYILFLSPMYLIWRARKHATPLPAEQTASILLATGVLLTVNLLFQFGVTPFAGLNFAPIMQPLVALFIAQAIYKHPLFQIIPFARAIIFEQMGDGVVVLDETNHIIDINPAAAEIIGVTVSQSMGKAARDVFSPWPDFVEKFRRTLEARETISYGVGESQRQIEVSFSPLYDQDRVYKGRVIFLHGLNDGYASYTKLSAESAALGNTRQPKVQNEANVSQPNKPEAGRKSMWWGKWLWDYFFPPLRRDLNIPADISPDWFPAMERAFTQVLRFGALLSPIDTFSSEADLFSLPGKFIFFLTLELSLSLLAIFRAIPFKTRAIGFILVLYAFGVAELYKNGYSAESFLFFIIVIVSTAFLIRGKSGWAALIASVVTLGIFGWLIKIGLLIPAEMNTVHYSALPAFFPIPSLFSFFICGAGLNIVLTATWENWHLSWRKERQAKNILKQERDLLDQRVQERVRELVQAEERYRLLVEKLPVVVYQDAVDKMGTTTYVSPKIEELLGYSAEEWVSNPAFWHNITHPDDRNIMLSSIEDVFNQGRAEHEYRVLARDGRTVWVHDEAVLIRDNNGQPEYVLGALQDITERKIIRERLRSVEKRFSHIVENIPDVFWITDPSNQAEIFISPSAEKVWGKNANDLMQNPGAFLETILGEDRPLVRDALARQAQGEATEIKYRILKMDGTLRWIWDRSFIVSDEIEKKFLVAGFAQDITETIQANEAAAHTAAQYRELFENSPVSLWEEDFSEVKKTLDALRRQGVTDFKSYLEAHPDIVARCIDLVKVVNVNKASLVLYRAQTKEELLGNLSGIFDGENLSNFLLELVNIAEGRTDFEWLGENLTLTNERLIVNIQWTAVAGYEESLSRVIVSIVDVTKEKEAEKILQRQNEQYAALSQIAIELLNQRKLDELLNTIVKKAALLLDAPYGEIMLKEGENLVVHAFTENQPFLLGDIVGRGEAHLTWQAHDTGQPAVVENYSNWNKHRNIYESVHLEAVADFPIMIGENCIGILGMARDQHGDAFDDHHIQLGQWLAQLAAVVLNNVQLLEATRLQVAALNTTANAIVITDRSGSILWVNPSFTSLTGYSFEEAIGQNPRILQSGRTPKELYKQLWGTILSGNTWRGEVINRRKDGGEYFEEMTITPLKNEYGNIYRFIAVKQDVTYRKQTEQALKESEEKYRLIYENIEDVIYQTDYHGIIMDISPSVIKQAGYRPEELIGQSVVSFFVSPEEYMPLATLIEEQAFVNDFEIRLKRKDGSSLYVSVTARAIFNENGQPISTEGVMRNISERKLAEERIIQMNAELEERVRDRTAEIQVSNKYLSTLLETTLIINKSLNLNDIFDHILIQTQKIIPCDALNLMLMEDGEAYIVRRLGGNGREELKRDLPDSIFSVSWPNFQKMIATGKSVYVRDTALDPNWQINPESEWIRTYIGVPLLISGKVIGFLNLSNAQPGFFSDKDILLLEAIANHASIAIQNARLLDETKDSLAREQQMRDQLVHADKLAVLGKMVAVIAHEINNPIQTVKNSIYLIEDQIIPGSPAVEYLKMASTEANRISDLVAQLRETYRARSKTFVRVNLLDLLAEVHTLLSPHMKKNQIDWELLNPTPTFVFAVRNNLKQVFINLTMNAIEAMADEPGGRLTTNFVQDNQWVGIEFMNSGPLIPEDALPHIFEPFFTTKGMGSGLGLSICYDIVKQHLGEITVENHASKGVVFTVWLQSTAEKN